MDDCIFCKIIRGEIPSKKVYEDETIFAFHDINPVAPIHVLIVPKVHVASLIELEKSHHEMIAHLWLQVPQIAKQVGLNDGFRSIVNTGRIGGQEVFHWHVHVLGGDQPLGRMVTT